MKSGGFGWYNGTVLAPPLQKKVHVLFDDGDCHWIDLQKNDWKEGETAKKASNTTVTSPSTMGQGQSKASTMGQAQSKASTTGQAQSKAPTQNPDEAFDRLKIWVIQCYVRAEVY